MSQAFISNNVHIVFSTKGRRPLIEPQARRRLWAYLGGIAKNLKAVPLSIGGTADHVHLLLALPSDLSIAKAVNLLKSNSSKWMNEHGHEFAWQLGYGAFSVSASNLTSVTAYIENQHAHHKERDYKHEFLALLNKHNVQFDGRYVLDE
jgi:putative transposase